MPEVSRFYGIIIRIYFSDHNPPHFHAQYGEYEAVISIESLAVLRGNLPARAHGLTIEWAQKYQQDLLNSWENAKNMQSPGKIEPLD